MRTLRMTLAYDGANYVGWQVQPNGPTVQAAFEAALARLTGETIRVVAAGRTDSGVHALGQVVSFSTGSTIPTDRFRPALRTHLPRDVVVREVREAPAGFNARYHARSKRYRYLIHDGPWRLPFLRNYVYQHRGRLDVGAMDRAAQVVVGTHDFRCFETEFPNRATSVRTVTAAQVARAAGWPLWMRAQDEDARAGAEKGGLIAFDIAADGFLYNMVRAIAGTLLKVGAGRWNEDDVRQILADGDRARAGETAPPQGLYLVEVDYDEPSAFDAG